MKCVRIHSYLLINLKLNTAEDLFQNITFDTSEEIYNYIDSEMKLHFTDNQSDDSYSGIRIVSTIEPRSNMDLNSWKILTQLKESFSNTLVIKKLKFNYEVKSDDDVHKDFYVGFYIVHWTKFYDGYLKKINPKASELQVMKDFIKVNNEYCGLISEEHRLSNLKSYDDTDVKLIMLLYLPKRPPVQNTGDVLKDLKLLMSNPSFLFPQLIFPLKNRDIFGLVLIKMALSIIRSNFRILGMGVSINIKVAVSKVVQTLKRMKEVSNPTLQENS